MSSYPTSLEPQQPTPRKAAAGSLIKLPDAEAARLLSRATQDYSDALQDNERRIEKFRRHFRSWRNKIGMIGGTQGTPNFRVPLIVEKVLIKWAKTLDALLGDDAEIVADPTGPIDQGIAHKVSRYMTWQLFNHMDITEELAKFIFQEIIFGRAHAQLYYDVRWLYGPGEARTLLYDGPTFKTLPMDCVITPPTAGETNPQEFRWLCTREWKSLDQLLADEREGYATGIEENAEAIWRLSQENKGYDPQQDRIRQEQAGFEGVVSDYAATDRNTVEVRKHYCRWRMLKGRADAEYDDFTKRQLRETELCAQYIPDLYQTKGQSSAGLLIGLTDLAELYPKTANRRPIVSASLFKDGSYWCPGLPELLEDIEIEKTVNHNLMNKAGELIVSPPGFYIPGMGISEEKMKLEPGMLYATPDPNSVKFADTKGDVQFCVVRDQMLTALAEGVSGLTAASVGRSADTPNTPRTFRGQALLQNQSDIRQQLEMMFMTEDWSKILDQIKMLIDEYGPEDEEFRVTEESASGFFETNKGFATITAKERQGKYDFKLKFATSAQSREARKERELAFLQAAAPLPIFIQNPNLQRDFLKVIARDLELDGLLPSLGAIPDANVPLDPQTEWAQALQGIDPQIHPQDDDEAHLTDHHQRIVQEMSKAEDERDTDAINRMIAHMLAHEDQRRQKLQMLMQAQAAANVQAALGAVGGRAMAGAGKGSPPAAGQAAALMGSPLSSGPGAGQQLAGFPGDIGGT